MSESKMKQELQTRKHAGKSKTTLQQSSNPNNQPPSEDSGTVCGAAVTVMTGTTMTVLVGTAASVAESDSETVTQPPEPH